MGSRGGGTEGGRYRGHLAVPLALWDPRCAPRGHFFSLYVSEGLRVDRKVPKAVSEAKKTHGRAQRISGEDALKLITTSPWNDAPGSVDKGDSVVVAEGLEAGDLVTVWPTDTGSSHKDTGGLVSISGTEVVIETRATDAAVTVLRVHAPRHGFRVRKSSQTRL